jgi:hypothetical protein
MSSLKERNINHGIVRVLTAAECGPPVGGTKFKLAEKAVLMYLALRCPDPGSDQPHRKPNQTFVSVRTIAHYLCTSTDTVIRALANLIALGLISRQLRNGRTTTSRLTLLHWDRIRAHQNLMRYTEEQDSIAEQSIAEQEEEEGALDRPDELDQEEPAEQPSRTRSDVKTDIRDILDLLRNSFGEHKSLSSKQDEKWLLASLNECVEQVCSIGDIFELLSRVLSDESKRGRKTVESLHGSKNLGNYMKRCLSDWRERYGDQAESRSNSDAVEPADNYVSRSRHG